MRQILKSILLIIFLPTILVAILLGTVKFQVLSYDFWQKTLSKNKTYAELSKTARTIAESITVKGGGSNNELKILTNVASVENVEEFVNNNLSNLINYSNGNAENLMIYLPLGKLPKSLVPKSEALNKDQMTASLLLSKFDIDASTLPISQLSYVGRTTTYLFILSIGLLILITYLLYLLTSRGNRFLSIGSSFFLTGLVFLSIVGLGNSFITRTSTNLASMVEPTTRLLIVLFIPILVEVIKTWVYLSFGLICVGFTLIFVKKPLVS